MMRLVVCRIQLGIEVSRNLRALFELCSEQLHRFAATAAGRSTLTYDEAANDLRAEIARRVASGFRLDAGTTSDVTYWLFGHRFSVAETWLRSVQLAHERTRKHVAIEIKETHALFDRPDRSATTRALKDVMSVVQDGHTLTLLEYRVINLRLHGADLAQISEIVGLAPRTVRHTRLTAETKIRTALGEVYEAARAEAAKLGLRLPGKQIVDRARARTRLSRTDREAIAVCGAGGMSYALLATLYGVTTQKIRSICEHDQRK